MVVDGVVFSQSDVWRFWATVEKGDGCWEWQGMRNEKGYGRIDKRNGGKRRTVFAHRAAYQLTTGPVPEGSIVMHTCDNPLCCNPSHLRTGTYADNIRDMVAKDRHAKKHIISPDKKRQPTPCTKPVRANPGKHLTEDEVRYIRREYANGRSIVDLGKEFGRSKVTIYYIVTHKTHAD
jgi:hypothetical protein